MRTVDDNVTIWRYLRLPAFLEMLMHNALFQTRVDHFDDALEGAYGYRGSDFTDVIQYLDPPQRRTLTQFRRNPRPDDAIVVAHPVEKEDTIQEARLHTAITCWYEHNEHESYAMWQVYGKDAFAVAIATTVGALRACFDANVVIGGVDYTTLPPHVESVAEMFFHKRPEFAYEREIRSVQVFPDRIPGPVQLQALSPQALDGLLREVIAAPGMRETSLNTLRGVISSLFHSQGLDFDPGRFHRSALDDDRVVQTFR